MGFNATAAVGLDNDDSEAVAPATPSAIHKCDLSFLPMILILLLLLQSPVHALYSSPSFPLQLLRLSLS